MSLIIGCVTKNFGIIVGDTQLSIGDLNRNEIRRETKIKLNSPAINFAYGILNKWTQYVVDPKKPSELTIIEEDKRLKRFINNPSIIDKAKYLKEYMKTLSKIDATAIFIEKSEDDSFNLEEVSSQSKENLSHLKKGDLSLLFNEPFYNINSSYVKSLLNDFYNDKKLSNSLEDIIYLLNNVLLKVISQGPNFNLLNNKRSIHEF